MTAQPKIRPPAVARFFNPNEADEINRLIDKYLNDVEQTGPAPKALIAPHAGFIYSGPTAAKAYGLLRDSRDLIKRAILLGPSHRVALQGIATSGADYFETPLGKIALDTTLTKELLNLPPVSKSDEAHAQEHSLEVHLPFLQKVLSDFTLVPLVVGQTEPEIVSNIIEKGWGDPESLIVISSDLSHFLNYEEAQLIDRETCKAIENLDHEKIHDEGACGIFPISGMLEFAKNNNLTITTLDLRNSGDTAGDKDRVVGYGAWAIS